MGIGDFVRRTVRTVETSVSGVVRDPLSRQSALTVGSLFTALPLNRIAKEASSKDGSSYQIQKSIVAEVSRDKAVKQGIRDLKAPQEKENRQLMGEVAAYVVIVAVVVVACVFSFGTLCAPAVGAGITGATMVNGYASGYKAEKKAEMLAKRESIAGANGPAFPINQQVGGAGGAAAELFNGDFSGLFTSLDPNTAAGMKTLVFISAVAGAVAVSYFGLKYLRK